MRRVIIVEKDLVKQTPFQKSFNIVWMNPWTDHGLLTLGLCLVQVDTLQRPLDLVTLL